MLDTLACLLVALCLITVRHAQAEASFHKMRATDALLSSSHKDAFSSHLQRMLQMDSDPFNSLNDAADLRNCSPVVLPAKSKCDARRIANLGSKAVESKAAQKEGATGRNGAREITNCSEPGCTTDATPGSHDSANLKFSSGERQQHENLVVYGPMTQKAFERMAQRKRSSLSAEHKEEEVDEQGILFPAAPEVPLKDEHGIPFPVGPEVPLKDKPRANFAPQSPAPQQSEQPKAYAESPAPQPDVVPRPYVESPAPQPDVPRPYVEPPAPQLEVESLTSAESPAPAPATIPSERSLQPLNVNISAGANTNSTLQQQEDVKSAEVPRGSGRPPMTEEEAARVAVHAAAVEAGLARKRELAHAHMSPESVKTVAPGSAAKARGGTPLTSTPKHTGNNAAHSASSETPAANSVTEVPDQPMRRRNEVERTLLMEGVETGSTGSQTKRAKIAQKRSTDQASRPRRAWSLMGGLLAMVLVFCVFSMFVLLVAAVVEGALQAEPGRITNLKQGLPLPQQWFSLSRALWRRCRRAYLAACNGLTQHQQLPRAARHDAGALAIFMRLFWNHLTDLKAAGQRAVNRMSCGGGAGSRYSSLGGASLSSGGAYAASRASYGGASHASCWDTYSASLASSGGSYAASRASYGGASHVSYGSSRRASYAGAPGYGMETSASYNVWGVGTAHTPHTDASEACVIQADDSATVTALAELHLRRRH